MESEEDRELRESLNEAMRQYFIWCNEVASLNKALDDATTRKTAALDYLEGEAKKAAKRAGGWPVIVGNVVFLVEPGSGRIHIHVGHLFGG